MWIHAAFECHKPRQLHYACQKVRGLYSSYCKRPLKGGVNHLLQQRVELYSWQTRSVWGEGFWNQPTGTSDSWLTPTSACWNAGIRSHFHRGRFMLMIQTYKAGIWWHIGRSPVPHLSKNVRNILTASATNGLFNHYVFSAFFYLISCWFLPTSIKTSLPLASSNL